MSRVARWLAGLLATALLAAVILVVATLPYGRVAAAGLAVALCWPLALVAVAALDGGRAAVSRSRVGRDVLGWLARPPVQLAATALGLVAVAGVYAANRFLTDDALGPITRTGYAVTLVAAVAAGGAVWWMTARSSVAAHLSRWPRWLPAAVTAATVAVITPMVDAVVIPLDHPALHAGCLGIELLAGALLASLLVRRARLGAVAATTALAAVALAVPGLAGDVDVVTRAAQPPGTLYFQLVTLARGLFDADGDGFSRILRGGDCDDRDPTAYPLSTRGRDCLGWIAAQQPGLPPAPAAADAPTSPRPTVIVLVTIDAFRCGFERFGRPELLDACPELTRLLREGRGRLDAHTYGPDTQIAMAGLHLGPDRRAPTLGERLRNAGYSSHAIITHPVVVRDPRVRASFDTVDDALVAGAARRNGSTAAAVTARALAWLRAADGTAGRRSFLWLHHYDPHAPYAKEAGAIFVADHLDSYRAEVRRTDAEIGRLARAMSATSRAAEALLVVTADHGEAFGEHGVQYHVSTMHEEVTRIPLVVWAPGGVDGFITGELPAALVDLGPFLEATVRGSRFTPSREAFMFTGFRDDPQVGIVRDGWKLIHHTRLGFDELYDLRADPRETDDRAPYEPERVTALGRRVGAHLVIP